MSIRVISNGILDTIQDAGRFGYAHLGINPSGVMDPVAMKVANYLVMNAANEAVIELHFPSASFITEQPILIATAGADFSMHINNQPAPINTPILVANNSLIEFKKIVKGARAYLAVHGGFNLQPWLKSYSTNLKANAGGYNGRALKKDDNLPIRHSPFTIQDSQTVILPWHADTSSFYNDSKFIRVTGADEVTQLTECAASIFNGNSFTITNQSDRMGYRLQGAPLERSTTKELISTGVTKGTIQLLPSGQLIILMADHQTTGGYPRLAHVISADIPKLAQSSPGTNLYFQLVTQQEAEAAYLEEILHLQQLKTAISFKNQQLLNS